MKYNKVMFIVPMVQASYSAALDPNLGIAYLTAVLEKQGVQVEIFDFGLGYDFEAFFKRLNKFKPDLIGVTLFSFGFVESYQLINRIKDSFDGLLVLGGVHVSALRGRVLEDTKADLAVYGEGENAIVDICKGKNFGDIDNLIYRKNGGVVENKQAAFVKELDSLPFPAWENFELKKYVYPKEGRLQIATSRGCPYNCVYCAVKRSMGLMFRPRSAENVLQEIEKWYRKGYTFFEFVDDCFTMDMARAKRICDMIVERGIKIQWNCANGIRADRVDEELLQKMKAAGCIFVAYGLETGNPDILMRIKKNITLDKAMEAFNLTKKAGIKFAVNFIVGHPDETYEAAMDSIKVAKKIPADYVNFSNMVPYPGTETYDYIRQHGKFLLSEETYLTESTTKLGKPVFETPEFSYAERLKVLKKGRALAKKTHLQCRMGKVVGAIVYQFVRSDAVYNLLRRIATGKFGKKIYNRLKIKE